MSQSLHGRRSRGMLTPPQPRQRDILIRPGIRSRSGVRAYRLLEENPKNRYRSGDDSRGCLNSSPDSKILPVVRKVVRLELNNKYAFNYSAYTRTISC